MTNDQKKDAAGQDKKINDLTEQIAAKNRQTQNTKREQARLAQEFHAAYQTLVNQLQHAITQVNASVETGSVPLLNMKDETETLTISSSAVRIIIESQFAEPVGVMTVTRTFLSPHMASTVPMPFKTIKYLSGEWVRVRQEGQEETLIPITAEAIAAAVLQEFA